MSDAAQAGYRESHLGRGKALDYDQGFWSTNSAKSLDWALEQRLLDLVFARHLFPPPTRAVDFACGTGRVLAYLETRVNDTTGVDVSPDMLAIARERCRRSRLLQQDVTVARPEGFDGSIQLVTAFRFFLNAEPALRRAGLAWIRSVLTPDGHLVANFHLNPRSLRGTYLRMRWMGRRLTPMLSPADVERLLTEAGFDLVARYSYQFLPFRREGAHLAVAPLRRWIEGMLVGRRILGRVGGAFLVVANVSTGSVLQTNAHRSVVGRESHEPGSGRASSLFRLRFPHVTKERFTRPH
jgi:SAM-dependent methyltransferase